MQRTRIHKQTAGQSRNSAQICESCETFWQENAFMRTGVVQWQGWVPNFDAGICVGDHPQSPCARIATQKKKPPKNNETLLFAGSISKSAHATPRACAIRTSNGKGFKQIGRKKWAETSG
jgi:hypothetical protein